MWKGPLLLGVTRTHYLTSYVIYQNVWKYWHKWWRFEKSNMASKMAAKYWKNQQNVEMRFISFKKCFLVKIITLNCKTNTRQHLIVSILSKRTFELKKFVKKLKNYSINSIFLLDFINITSLFFEIWNFWKQKLFS